MNQDLCRIYEYLYILSKMAFELVNKMTFRKALKNYMF